MAEREDVTGLTEDALFDQAIDPPAPEPTPPPPPSEPEPQPVPQSEPKPDGKPGQAEQLDTATASKEDDGPLVPTWRLREITEERRAAQAERDAIRQERDRLVYEQQEFRRRLAQLEKPVEPPPEPDPLLDPRGYREFMEKRFEDRLANERRESSLQFARKANPKEFDQAYEAARQYMTPGLMADMQRSADPGETLMGWFKQLKWAGEAGNDPVAYRKKISDENLKDPEFRKRAMEAWRTEAQSSQQSNGRPMLAPSLNGVSRSSAALRASQQDLSDDDLWSSTTN